MTDSNWKRVFELYEAASLLAPKDAEAFLNRLSDDPQIIQEVRALILGLDAVTTEPESDSPPPEPKETSQQTRTGTRLGRYEVLDRIGRGATAEVYAGRDTVLNRPVALKFLAGSSAIMPSLMRRFLREAQAASALNHPNIVTIHEILEPASDSPVMVMELVEGQALRQFCGTPMRESRASRIAAQIALALSAAHAKGLIHRDLKPENIVVRDDGYVKVLDFGLVKQLPLGGGSLEENLTSMAGLPVGTLRYMSPEQCRGEQTSAASDIFALGIIMQELVAGSHPFVRGDGAGGAFDVAHAIANLDPKPLTTASAAYRELVALALSKDPHARPSAAVLAKRLGAPPPGDTTQIKIRTLEPPAASSQNMDASADERKSRRRILQIATAGGAALAAAAAGAGVFYRQRKARLGASPNAPSASRILIPDGNAADPVFSPDGSTLAFAWAPPGSNDSHIYLLRDDGKGPTQLTFSSGFEREPVWSPDGSRIAFVRQGTGEAAFYLIPLHGGAERRLATNPVPQVVGFMSWISNTELILQEHVDGGSFLVRFHLATGTKQQITLPQHGVHTGGPHCSPDLKWIAYLRTSSDTTMDLHLLPSNATTASEPRRLTFDDFAKREFCWLPDNSGLVYHRNESYFHIPAQGGAPREIPQLQAFNGTFSIRPSGSSGRFDVAVTRIRRLDSIWRLQLASATGGEPPPPARFISSGPGSIDVDPALSSDGARLAFLSLRSGRVEIWATNAYGEDPVQLTSFNGPELYAPAWSPDGKYVVSSGRFDGSNNVFRVPTTGGAKPEILYRSNVNLILPTYSPDGRWVTFSSPADGDDQLFRIAAGGQGKPERLTRNGGYCHQYSADGEWIYLTHRRSPGLWRIPSKGGPAELVLDNVIPSFNRAWKVTPSGAIYFATQEPGSSRTEIRRYLPRTRKVDRVLTVTNPFPRWHDAIWVGPKEQWLLFPQREAADSTLHLVEEIPIPGA